MFRRGAERGPQVGVVVVAAALVLLRLRWGHVHGLDHVWAEDGRDFLADAHDRGLGAFTVAYNGYGHLVPRILAWAGAALPLRDYAGWCEGTAALVAGLVAGHIFGAMRRRGATLVVAAIPSIALVLAPALSVESLGAICNAQWFLLPGLFWSALDRPTSRGARWSGWAIAGLTAASSLLALLVLPIVIITRAWRSSRGFVISLACGLTYQAAVLAGGRTDGGATPRHLRASIHFVGSFLEQSFPGRPHAELLGGLLAAGLITVIVVHARGVEGLAIAAGVVSFVVIPSCLNGSVATRYTALAQCVALGAAGMLVVRSSRWWQGSFVALALLGLLCFPVTAYRVSGERWGSAVSAYRAACSHGQTTAPVALAPADFGPAIISCPRPQPGR